jgi:hypothetical protein
LLLFVSSVVHPDRKRRGHIPTKASGTKSNANEASPTQADFGSFAGRHKNVNIDY